MSPFDFGKPKCTHNGLNTGPETKKCVRRRRRNRFFLHFWSPWARKIGQNRNKRQNRRKNRKITKKLPKTDQRLFDLGRPNGLEIHQKCRKSGSKKRVKKITLQNTAVLAQGGIFRRKTSRFRGISG